MWCRNASASISSTSSSPSCAPRARGHVPARARARRRRRRERPEVVLADDERRACVERGAIDRRGDGAATRAARSGERARAREHAVLVAARERREARVEARRAPRGRRSTARSRGEQRAQRVGRALGRWAAVDDHAQRPGGRRARPASVRPATASVAAEPGPERRRARRRACPRSVAALGLARPAGEARPVVLERQAKRPLHRRDDR